MNLTFTLCFTVECVLKLISYGPGVNKSPDHGVWQQRDACSNPWGPLSRTNDYVLCIKILDIVPLWRTSPAAVARSLQGRFYLLLFSVLLVPSVKKRFSETKIWWFFQKKPNRIDINAFPSFKRLKVWIRSPLSLLFKTLLLRLFVIIFPLPVVFIVKRGFKTISKTLFFLLLLSIVGHQFLTDTWPKFWPPTVDVVKALFSGY